MRLRADIFVSAYIRRCEVENVVAMLRKRGAAEAGAIFVKVDRLDVEARLLKEQRFDPDMWIIETEDRAGRCFLDLARQ